METILLVDENIFSYESEINHLEKAGYKVLYTPSGQQAFETYSQNKSSIDLVIITTDIHYRVSGYPYKLLEDIRSINPNAKYIILCRLCQSETDNLHVCENCKGWSPTLWHFGEVEKLLGLVRYVLDGLVKCTMPEPSLRKNKTSIDYAHFYGGTVLDRDKPRDTEPTSEITNRELAKDFPDSEDTKPISRVPNESLAVIKGVDSEGDMLLSKENVDAFESATREQDAARKDINNLLEALLKEEKTRKQEQESDVIGCQDETNQEPEAPRDAKDLSETIVSARKRMEKTREDLRGRRGFHNSPSVSYSTNKSSSESYRELEEQKKKESISTETTSENHTISRSYSESKDELRSEVAPQLAKNDTPSEPEQGIRLEPAIETINEKIEQLNKTLPQREIKKDKPETLNIALFGNSRVGKTVLVMSAAFALAEELKQASSYSIKIGTSFTETIDRRKNISRIIDISPIIPTQQDLRDIITPPMPTPEEPQQEQEPIKSPLDIVKENIKLLSLSEQEQISVYLQAEIEQTKKQVNNTMQEGKNAQAQTEEQEVKEKNNDSKKLTKEQKRIISEKYISLQLSKKQQLQKNISRKKTFLAIKQIEEEVSKLFEQEELNLEAEILQMLNIDSGKVYFYARPKENGKHYLDMQCYSLNGGIYKYSLGQIEKVENELAISSSSLRN